MNTKLMVKLENKLDSFPNEINGKYIMFPTSFRKRNARFSFKWISPNNNKIFNELSDDDIILFKNQIFGMEDNYVHIGYNHNNNNSRNKMNFYVIKKDKKNVYVFENGHFVKYRNEQQFDSKINDIIGDNIDKIIKNKGIKKKLMDVDNDNQPKNKKGK